MLRHEGEAVHTGYFHDRIRVVMHDYLNSTNGKREVEHLITYLEEAARKLAIQEAEEELERLKREAGPNGKVSKQQLDKSKVVVVPPEMKKKKNIYEIFRKYDADGSNSIDPDELRILLTELKVPMTDEELDALFDELDEDGGGDIGFEEFYNWFVREADKQRQKAQTGVIGMFRKVVKSDVFDGFKRLVLEVEARNLAMDHAVWKATCDARIEYRKAHPPRWLCSDPHCGAAFTTKKQLETHQENVEQHAKETAAREEEVHRFKTIEAVLAGPHGRNILANRLLFSVDLGDMATRINAAKETPFRPRETDPGGRRKQQLLDGMLVVGADPKSGIRPGHRQYGLVNQHRAPGRRHDQPSLQDVIATILHCRDETIDIVTAPSTSSHAEVLFIWKGFARTSVALAGDFNGWKAEEMLPNSKTGKAGLIKNLGPGKYRYRFIIDGEDRIDETCSMIEDGPERFVGAGTHHHPRRRFGMGGVSNILLVINPMSVPKQETSNLKPRILRDSTGGDLSARSMSTIATSFSAAGGAGIPTALSPPTSPLSPKLGKKNRSRVAAGPGSPLTAAPGVDDDDDHHLPLSPSSQPSPVDRPKPSTTYEDRTVLRQVDYDASNDCVIMPPPAQHELIGLTKINLRNMCLYDDGAWAFSAFLQRNSHIKQIDLSNNSISDEGMEAIASALPTMLQLEVIKLNGNNAGVDGVRYLVKFLKNKPTLLRFEICANKIGDDGAELLAEGLIMRNPNLRELYLDSCYICTDGIASICHALNFNKVLRVLSLANNRVMVEACKHLAVILSQNATLAELNLSGNPLGADGIKIIGDGLVDNETLRKIDLSSVDLLRGNSGLGINAILNMLRVNHNLRHLSLRNNRIGSHPLFLLPIDIAYAMTFNKGLLELDLEGNPMDGKWFEPNKTIPTQVLKDMPSIRSSLDRIRKLFSDPDTAARLNKVDANSKREIDPSFDGYWTHRRKWKKVNRKAEERRALQLKGSQEEVRILLEKEHIDDTVDKHLLTLSAFLDNPDCASFVQTLARLVRTHMSNLIQLQPPPQQENEGGESGGLDDDNKSFHSLGSKGSKGSKGSNATPKTSKTSKPSAGAGLVQSVAAAKEAEETRKREAAAAAALAELGGDDGLGDDDDANKNKRGKDEEEEETKSQKAARLAAEREAERISRLIPFDDATFNAMHTAITRAVFGELHCDSRTLTILPERIIEACFLMGIPLSVADAQDAVTACQVPKRPLLSFRRFLEYTKTHAARLVAKQSFSRRRMETDLYFNPPVEEAKRIVLGHAESVARREIRREYRAQKGHEPVYCCALCHERFSSLRVYEKHMSKGVNSPQHLQLLLLDEVHAAQSFILRHAKFLVTNTYFPCFYELHPVLPEEYTPQVFDAMGEGGRPIGVIEPDMTVLVEDVLGDFVQISFQGQLGWVKFRIDELKDKKLKGAGGEGDKPAAKSLIPLPRLFPKKEKMREILRSACTGVANFSWDNLQVLSKSMFYQVRDDPTLPPKMELKVRLQPVLSAPVCGYLKLGQVVESRATLGDWMQIKFQDNDAAWVVRKVGGGMHFPAPPPIPESVLVAEMTAKMRAARAALKEELAAMNPAARRRKRMEIAKRGGLAAILSSKEEVQEEIAAGLTGAEMFKVLHPSVQYRLSHIVTYSPFTPKPEHLMVDLEWKLVEIGADLGEGAEEEDEGAFDGDEHSEGHSMGSKASGGSKAERIKAAAAANAVAEAAAVDEVKEGVVR